MVLGDGRTPQLPHDKEQDDGANVAGPGEHVEPRGMHGGSDCCLGLDFEALLGFLFQCWKDGRRLIYLDKIDLSSRRRPPRHRRRIDHGRRRRDRCRWFRHRRSGFCRCLSGVGQGRRRLDGNHAWLGRIRERLHGNDGLDRGFGRARRGQHPSTRRRHWSAASMEAALLEECGGFSAPPPRPLGLFCRSRPRRYLRPLRLARSKPNRRRECFRAGPRRFRRAPRRRSARRIRHTGPTR